MWYVIWTATGSERKLNTWIADYMKHSLYEDCFVPMVDQNRKVKGKWKTIRKPLFPGYMFVKTDESRIGEFADRLKRSGVFTAILSTDVGFTPVNAKETYLIDSAYNNEGILGTSIGMIEGDTIKILSGPLMGLEGAIKMINRHKRTATIELNMFGRISRVNIGLEIISKT
ncbi:antiterminator LoaP [Butyrivibrio sp. AE2032]|uniref:antiterminator LoaP n=1 Tax=Butyrivibrio sp. AE2032 TaxID=1458463 RepID=UPI00054E2CF5|nr:antiterminator LoaP [Butyrivibrio sp. AE2032]